MGKIHVGATLIPHFRDFLPGWVARQPWYAGSGIPSLRPIGWFRFEDPAGEVGLETHLVHDGTGVHQVPMTYRGAPMPGPAAASALIAEAEHSVLGRRWIYDATADPVWTDAIRRLVVSQGTSDPSRKRGAADAEARGHLLAAALPDSTTISLTRRLDGSGGPEPGPAATVGTVTGTWYPDGPGSPPVTGLLAVLHSPANG
jgi:hypothetical protein